jgi:hypothetical protein
MPIGLKALDIFGKPLQLYLNDRKNDRTRFGGLISLALIIIIVIISYFLGKDIYLKQDPRSYQYTNQFFHFPAYNLTKNDFSFAFNAADLNNYPIMDDRYFTISARLIVYDLIDGYYNLTYIPIPLAPCNYSDFLSLNSSEYVAGSISTFMCPQVESINLAGYWGDSFISVLDVIVQYCDYTNLEKNCHSKEEIDKYILDKNINVAILYLETYVNLKDYLNPVKKYVSVSYKFINTMQKKYTNLFLQNQSVITDEGIIFSDVKEENFFKLIEQQTDSIVLDLDNKILYEMMFYTSNKSDIYNRKYITIPEIIASVGGAIKFIQIWFLFIISVASNIGNYEYIWNEVFFYPSEYNKKEIQPINHENNKITQFAIKKTEENKFNIDKQEQSQINFLQTKNLDKISFSKTGNIANLSTKNVNQWKKLSLSISDKMKLLCINRIKKHTDRNNFLRQIKKQIDSFFNFIRYIKIGEEYYQLKEILLTRSKSSLLNDNIQTYKIAINNENKLVEFAKGNVEIQDLMKCLPAKPFEP